MPKELSARGIRKPAQASRLSPAKGTALSAAARTELCRVYNQLAEEVAALCVRYETTPQQQNVLRVLMCGDNGIPVMTIRDRLDTRVPDVPRLVDRLISVGLVTTKSAPHDRRVTLVSITKQGRTLAERVDRQMSELTKRQFSRLSAKDLQKLTHLLRVLQPNIDHSSTSG